MRLLKFISEMPKGMVYGTRQTFTPGIWGKFEGINCGPGSELVHGIMVGDSTFKRDRAHAFVIIGFIKIMDNGSPEYILVGVDAFSPPTQLEQEDLFQSVMNFAKKNFIVGTYGDSDAAIKLTASLGE